MAVTAAVTALAVLLSGTYAWTSLSQIALNEVDGEPNPGGRLHDDFNGENKDVYVENFSNQNIYVRVRLDEYLEIGAGAGTGSGGAHSIVEGAELDDRGTWTTYVYGDEESPFRQYYELSWGGSTVYMPTFNKDNESLEADINGTYANDYEDYATYEMGDQVTDDAVYSADESQTETHTATTTQTATVISMKDWIEMGSPTGDFWVYDTDGWAYWAEALAPSEATGLLLDGISLVEGIAEEWYYAINVVAQFATAGDIGFDTDDTGFYDLTINSAAPTASAETLLERITGVYSDWWYEIQAFVEENGLSTTQEDRITIDGRDWYVLANEGTKYLIWAAELEPTYGDGTGYDDFDDSSALWADSSTRSWMNYDYMHSLTTLNQFVQETEISTRTSYGVQEWTTTTDLAFLLSEADVRGYTGWYGSDPTAYEQDYTYNGQVIVPDALRDCTAIELDDDCSEHIYHWWTRTIANDAGTYVTCFGCDQSIPNFTTAAALYYGDNDHMGIRPAMWIDVMA